MGWFLIYEYIINMNNSR